MAKPVGLKTIAERCGLSVSAVSQILNRKAVDYSSEATRELVFKTVRELGYKRSFGYKLMRREKTQTVAVISARIFMKGEEHLRELVVNLTSDLEKLGYSTYFCTLEPEAETNLDRVRELLARGVEHFIIIGTPSGYAEMEDEVEKAGRLLVATNQNFKRFVDISSGEGVEKIIRFFHVEAGENFRLFQIAQQMIPDDEKIQALMRVFPKLSFEKAVRKYVRSIPNFEIGNEDTGTEAFAAAYAAAPELFADEPGIQAVCCANDALVLGIAKYLVEQGKIIGRDVLLAGVNNNFAVRTYPFPISSVDHNWKGNSHLLIKAALNPGPCRIVIQPLVCLRTTREEKQGKI